VTGETVEKGTPEWIGLGSGGCRCSLSILDLIAVFRVWIFEVKMFKNVFRVYRMFTSRVIGERILMEEVVDSLPALFGARARTYRLCPIFFSGVVD
jgi:hypothetical protein